MGRTRRPEPGLHGLVVRCGEVVPEGRARPHQVDLAGDGELVRGRGPVTAVKSAQAFGPQDVLHRRRVPGLSRGRCDRRPSAPSRGAGSSRRPRGDVCSVSDAVATTGPGVGHSGSSPRSGCFSSRRSTGSPEVASMTRPPSGSSSVTVWSVDRARPRSRWRSRSTPRPPRGWRPRTTRGGTGSRRQLRGAACLSVGPPAYWRESSVRISASSDSASWRDSSWISTSRSRPP